MTRAGGLQAGGGIAISGLPAELAGFNATFASTGGLVEGFPVYAAGRDTQLLRDPRHDTWVLSHAPFDPAVTAGLVWIPAARGPVPAGQRTRWV